MAYIDQARKAVLAPAIQAILKKYGIKGTLSIRQHRALVLSITSGSIDFILNFNETNRDRKYFQPASTAISVNPYWIHETFSGSAFAFLAEIIPAMNLGNHDNSDIQSDYFDVGWYIDINIGRWDKPYKFVQGA